MMRAKLTVKKVNTNFDSSNQNAEINSQNILFSADYDPNNSPEDNNYSKYTPAASLDITVTNPDLFNKIQEGDKFYVDFTKIP